MGEGGGGGGGGGGGLGKMLRLSLLPQVHPYLRHTLTSGTFLPQVQSYLRHTLHSMWMLGNRRELSEIAVENIVDL